MSGLTPSRIRSKTSELTDFFRAGHGHTRSPANDLSTQSQASTNTLDVSTSTGPDGLAKKKSTRIPFLGRPRKKSNPYASDSARESSDVGEQTRGTASTDRRPTVELSERSPSSRLSMLPPSPGKAQPTSLGSKLAAHFSPRTRKLSALSSKPPLEETSKTASLSPPDVTASRGTSLDSGSSGARSPTPRPVQPTIMVSMSNENLDEYKDLFTLPKQKKPLPRESPSPRDTPESDGTSSSGPSTSPRISKLVEAPRRGSAPTILESSRQKSARNQQPESPAIKSIKPPRRSSPTEKQDSPTPSTPRTSDGKESARSSLSDKLTGPSIQRRQITTPASEYSAQQRLRLRQQAAAAEKLNKPPSIPLPQPPPSSPQMARASTSPTTSSPSIPPPRPRASTVGSVASVASASSRRTQCNAPADGPQPEDEPPTPPAEGNRPDLDSATREELKESLQNRTRQYDELKSHLQKTVDKHNAEKIALEKKVSQLEREMAKKDNQIKGLMWLVANNKGPPATDFPPNLALPPLPATNAEPGQEPPRVPSKSRLPSRRTQLSDDSGAESHPTSGAESIRSSETSGNESGSLRYRKLRRPFGLGEGSHSLYLAATGSRRSPPKTLAPDSALPEVPTHSSNRSSISSFSPSSSTSSLLPPSPSMTLSSLSSIPETPSSLRYSSKPTSLSDSEDRRGVRTANRISTSSMASSSTAASSAYAANLKRSRPPSIAQVLENSPNMGDVLDKLRPFAPSS
ncbi:hypothetical protein CC1G_06923 [Coprinopsis cinerea okayama7|uniref:Uncharacterized protein n=1 Tax=Coprinopsis cinerea (strain Okayama-7 / 130 / ATCC MYA-4618 / FGSC 9003) TaxID=240176 RepID=A8NZP5_COPC7|nr:hypothetical protein CC1G_06923 [Coprinopsis cinerea okayama7\|eukprot:XP_001837717.2 hypothetical protein CC1G_06923 [Coprinopsis cinerea okayama7\